MPLWEWREGETKEAEDIGGETLELYVTSHRNKDTAIFVLQVVSTSPGVCFQVQADAR